jgi:predicted Zn-dependent peptidase
MPFADTGAAAVYVGTTPTQTDEVLKLVREEIEKVMADGITEDELQRAKGNVKGSLAMSMEDSNSRMTRLGRDELTGIDHLSVDEIVGKIEAVENDEIIAVARDVYAGPKVIGAVGPFDASDLEEFVQ